MPQNNSIYMRTNNTNNGTNVTLYSENLKSSVTLKNLKTIKELELGKSMIRNSNSSEKLELGKKIFKNSESIEELELSINLM